MRFAVPANDFDKNANFVSVGMDHFTSAELVWRLSRFAFFGAVTSVGALFIFGEVTALEHFRTLRPES